MTRRQVAADAAVSIEVALAPHSPPDSRLDLESPEDRSRDWQPCQTDDSTGAGSRYEDEVLLDDSPGGHSWSSHDGYFPMSSNQGSYEAPSAALLDYGAQPRARSENMDVQQDWTSLETHTKYGIKLYFDMFAPSLPIIHQGTFDPAAVPEFLLLGMLSIGFQYNEKTSSAANTSMHYYERAVALVDSIDDVEVSDAKDALVLAQSLFLLEICAVLYLCGRHSATGFRLHTRLITLARSHRLLQARPQQDETMAEDLEAVWEHFAFAESSDIKLLSHVCSAVRQIFASDCPAEHITAASDPFGLTSFAHFALSSIREVSGWSSITGCVSMDRVEPLKASLHTISPYNESTNGTETSSIADNISFRATWEMAMIDLRIWSISHTDGVVHSSIDAALEHSTYLAASRSLTFSAEILHTIQPHFDWFLRYLDAASEHAGDPPWVLLFAYRVFLLAWQCLQQASEGVMEVIGIPDREPKMATTWARTVFERRSRWQYAKVIFRCLDVLEGVS
ncbi:uncharacterized protein RHO25_012916 [Cercospora beticola]|uniref:Xylanolytic transcriptional activator regulatory domain-containing protein n=1 Tax=Cercospora beticola TaxID=122368 RepID=A0ABZ0P957_CERBT|nr:hypothetical protein RHO25_012916 [Cercospora beticola]